MKPNAASRSRQRDVRSYNTTIELTAHEDTHVPLISQDSPSYGEPRRKRRIDYADAAAVIVSLSLFTLAYITVAPCTRVPWQLGLTRQFQIVGLLLSAMNHCFLSLAPTVFVLIEARFGRSYLQNYDAILRKSFTKADTSISWRGVLISVTIIPVALSLAYKEFNHGISNHVVEDSVSHIYGMLPVAGLQDRWVGLTYFANTTMSFTAAIFDDPPVPTFPSAYGYNTLVLSNTSSAKLDAPSPQYVREIQNELLKDESYSLTSRVYATVTSYNDSVESHRDDDDFWNYYLSQMHDPPNEYTSQPNDSFKDAYLESKLSGQDLYNNVSISALANSFFLANTSWMFFAFIPTELEQSDVSTHADAFRQSALLFNTRRESCIGSWKITYNSVQLLIGSCDQPPLSEEHQQMLTNTGLALPQWYLTSLGEYLGPFTEAAKNNSPWKMPAFCTVLAGMYWSRITSFNVKSIWGTDGTTYGATSNISLVSPDIYYLVGDTITSSRVTMNPAGSLYFVLAIFPVLTVLLFACTIMLHSAPLDSGFGIIALLAGVRTRTLNLLKGASRSGKLSKPIRVSIAVHQISTVTVDGGQEIVYTLHDT